MGELVPLQQRRILRGQRVGSHGEIERERDRPLRCVVLDVSRHGACVWAPATALPEVFVLRSVALSRRACEIMWRKGDVVGARFVGMDRLLTDAETASAKVEQRCRAYFHKTVSDETP